MRIQAFLVLVMFAAGACSTTFRLPAVNDAEIRAATADIEGSGSLKPVIRTERAARTLVNNSFGRLQKAAGPICAQVEYDLCRFTVHYDHADQTPNAWASGENEITITGGLVRYLYNEDEVAAVIGHEMGHHIVGHIDSAANRVLIGQILGAVLGAGAAIALDADPTTTALAANTGGIAGAYTGYITHSKEDEREADYISVYLLARADYDLEAASGVWARLAKGSGNNMSTGMLDTHPASPDRLAAWRRAMNEVAQDDDLLPTRDDE